MLHHACGPDGCTQPGLWFGGWGYLGWGHGFDDRLGRGLCLAADIQLGHVLLTAPVGGPVLTTPVGGPVLTTPVGGLVLTTPVGGLVLTTPVGGPVLAYSPRPLRARTYVLRSRTRITDAPPPPTYIRGEGRRRVHRGLQSAGALPPHLPRPAGATRHMYRMGGTRRARPIKGVEKGGGQAYLAPSRLGS